MNDEISAPIKAKILQIADLENITKKELFERLGVSSSNFRGKSLMSEINADVIAKISSVFPSVNIQWVLTGTGSFFNTPAEQRDQRQKNSGIPLVSKKAVAGFGNEFFSIEARDVKEYYCIPKFKHLQVDFLIEITGLSMYPSYGSGDIVACSVIRDSAFIQWNRVHLIATNTQGLLVKRIRQSEDPDMLLMVSDNPEYPPFAVPKTEITGLALIVGAIKVE